MKAKKASEALELEQIPNVGGSIAEDLRTIGIKRPNDLIGNDPLKLYKRLSPGRRDPCVLDTFMAAVDFMQGGRPKPWWSFTAKRKKLFGQGSR